MFKVYYGNSDDNVLHSPHLEYDGYVLTDARLSLELNTAGTFEFTMNYNHPLYDIVKECQNEVYVYDGDELIFSGYITNINIGFYKEKTCTCQGILSILADAVSTPYAYTRCTANTLMERLISTYNFQIGNNDADKYIQWQQNNINIPNGASADSFENSDFCSIWEDISSQIIQQFGGYIFLDKVNPRTQWETNELRYVADLTEVAEQEIRFGQNLTSFQNSTDSTEVITCLYPIGADGLDITSVNQLAYITNANLIAKYGYKFGGKIWDSITNPSELLRVATQWLEQNGGIQTLELSAVDLSYIDVDIKRFRLGQNVRVVSEPHGLDGYFLIYRLEIDLNDISNNTILLGKKKDSLTDRIISKTL